VRLRTTTALLLALAAVTAAGCGSDEEQGSPIPEQAAVDLESRLDEVQRRLDDGSVGACQDITNDSAPMVEGIVASLPQDVDPDVRQALQDGFDRLFTLTDERCAEIQSQEPEPEPAPQPQPTETESQTDTETVPTVPEPEPETTPTVPDEAPVDPIPPEEGGDGGSGGASGPEEGEG
jgi:outer membrane biosynthesis protein TonB